MGSDVISQLQEVILVANLLLLPPTVHYNIVFFCLLSMQPYSQEAAELHNLPTSNHGMPRIH